MEKDIRMYLRPGKVAEYFEIKCMGYLISEGYAPAVNYYSEEENETTQSKYAEEPD